MTASTRAAIAIATLLHIHIATVHPQDQQRAPLAGARFDHIAIAARDADRTARQLATLLGIDPPASRNVAADAPGGRTVRLKTALVNTLDFRVEVNQPISGPSPTQQFLERLGPGIEHIGFAVTGAIADRVQEMVRLGGMVTLGKASGSRAIVAFPNIGLSIELAQETTSPGLPAPTLPSASLAARKASHIGFVYRDAQPALAMLARLLGTQTPSLTPFQPIDYRPGDASDPGAHVKFAQLRTGGASLEVIEPIGGPSPWMDFTTARRGAGGPHHLAFTFGAPDNDFDSVVRHLQKQGGRWRKGQRGVEGHKSGSSPEFEFLDTLGFVIEVSKAGA